MIDVKDASTFTQRSCTLANGHAYHYVDQVPMNYLSPVPMPVCVLLHGFPDLWYGWRYQIKALSEAGYRVIAPSQLGYAPSSQPDDLDAYGYGSLTSDLAELLHIAGVNDPILLMGHDWGGLLAWRFANFYPARVKAIAVVCTPYLPPATKESPYIKPETLVEKHLPNFGYQLWFATDEATAILNKNLEAFLTPSFSAVYKAKAEKEASSGWVRVGEMRKKYLQVDAARKQGKVVEIPTKASDPELHFYLDSYRKSGFQQPLNYYRNRKVTYDQEKAAGVSAQFPPGIPALLLAATKDAALPLSMSDNSAKYFAPGQYERKIMEGADHWVLQDVRYREKVNDILLLWAAKQGSSSVSTKARL